MVDTIYIEREVLEHPRVETICRRYPGADRVVCERYGEVFNPKRQSFNLQKRRPALILARKHRAHVLPAPEGYGVGGSRNFYFSHMLNCLYDCRYCFLQGMYRSAHYVVFVNYEDFADAIGRTCAAGSQSDDLPIWFFSGYDGDSLAYEPVTGFVEYMLPVFERLPAAHLELRTKSTQIRGLLDREPLPNVVVAFSFTPHEVSGALEHKVPALEKRLAAVAQLQSHGWQVGLRFDPLIYFEHFERGYRELMERIFALVDGRACHSVTFGPFRLPQDYFKTMVGLYPGEPLFAGPLDRKAKMVSYHADLEKKMLEFCEALLLEYIAPQVMFSHAVA